MIFYILLIGLFLSVLAHIFALFSYILKKNDQCFKKFIKTAIYNIIITGVCILTAIIKPHLVHQINMVLLSWLMAGMIMVATFGIKVNICIKIYRRAKDPENFHYNIFGKKVLHPSVVNKNEFLAFIAVIPFFLISGSYFVARLIRFFMETPISLELQYLCSIV